MKYKVEIEIKLPRNHMLLLFQDMEFMKKWQIGFQSLEAVEGQAGEVNSKSKLSYLTKNKRTEIMETILLKELPDRFDFLYEAKGVKNWAKNTFIEKDNHVLWLAEHEFAFSGLMKLLNFFPNIFIKQTRKDMMAFKHFAEMSINES